jgi:hypothetical protein
MISTANGTTLSALNESPHCIGYFLTSPNESAEGTVLIEVRNTRETSNAVISIIEWVQKD